MLVRLLPLALATFAVGTDGLVIAGLLPAIAADLHVGVATAGQLVSAFALTYAISAPLVGAATAALDRRTVLLGALGVLALGNAATALAGTYPLVMAARIATAAGSAVIVSAAATVATSLAPPARRGRALAAVMGGFTVAGVLGVPAGLLVGAADWHVTLWAVAGLALVAAGGIAAGVPRLVLPAAPLAARMAPLARPSVLGVLASSVLAMSATYVLLTYVAVASAGATGGRPGALIALLAVVGAGTVGGNALAGFLVERAPAARVLAVALVGLAFVLAVEPFVAASLPAVLVWGAAFGVLVGMPVVLQQSRLLAGEPGDGPVLLGLNSSSIYVGIALGGVVGGIAQQWLAPAALGPVAAVAALAALVPLAGRVRTPERAPDPSPSG